MSSTNELLSKILENPRFDESDKLLIQKAYNTAELAHRGQKRMSGDDYITHPLKAAHFLFSLKMDATTIASALLHDTIEDTNITAKYIEDEFGQEIRFLVEGVTKLGKIEYSPDNPNSKTAFRNTNSLKKMLFAMAEDIRVIIIKLADRYHNMQTIKYLPKDSQKRFALETLEIYAPIAARLGMGRYKGDLEDMAFPYVYPDEYRWLIKNLKERYQDRTDYIERTKPIIKRKLTDAGIIVLDMHSRAKHYYSLYQKIRKQGMNMEKIFDLVAMRIIVPDVKSCYEALGIIHRDYKPLPRLIKDYIALPKPNGYQSLHTTIFCEKGRIVEMQIRTPQMHEHAENGIAAHWAYSESGKKRIFKVDARETRWISDLRNFLKDMPPQESLTHLKVNFFKNRIFAFTPKGDVRDLPEGSTPIDFAYTIHTDLGHSIKGAKVNEKIVQLGYKLKNGDVVEIIKGKVQKPSFDWIKISKTSEAKRKIKSWFAAEERKELGIKNIKREETPIKKPGRKKIVIKEIKRGVPIIEGQSDLMYKIAKCCNPKVGEKIKGYVTLNQGVSIHNAECSNINKIKNSASRILSAVWSK